MEKNKLYEARKSKGLSQNVIAEKLCMDVSSYNRREKGQVKIHITEWEKLAEILDVPLEEIYEYDENQLFMCKDKASANFLGTNNGTSNIYTVPESLLETQQKYIQKLEEEIAALQKLLHAK